MALPKKRKKPVMEFSHYTGLLYGREKIGKSILISLFPDTVYLTTEPGTEGLSIFEIPCPDWRAVLKAVRDLEKDKDRFKTVAVDTADCAYDICLDYVCAERGIPYPGQDEDGKEDFGKSWKAVRREFTNVIHRIKHTGRTIWFTSHAKESRIRSRSGGSYDRVFPTMSGQARQVIEPLVDFIFFLDYMQNQDGETIRIIVTQGDESIWAGFRPPAQFPKYLPLLEEGGYGVLVQGFKGEHPGIDPATLRVSKRTSKVMTQVLQAEKVESAHRKLAGKKKKKRKKRRRK